MSSSFNFAPYFRGSNLFTLLKCEIPVNITCNITLQSIVGIILNFSLYFTQALIVCESHSITQWLNMMVMFKILTTDIKNIKLTTYFGDTLIWKYFKL
jgi:hypothetical protein